MVGSTLCGLSVQADAFGLLLQTYASGTVLVLLITAKRVGVKQQQVSAAALYTAPATFDALDLRLSVGSMWQQQEFDQTLHNN
jgi:hypothetical protein